MKTKTSKTIQLLSMFIVALLITIGIVMADSSTLVPNGDITTQWTSTEATHYGAIDEGMGNADDTSTEIESPDTSSSRIDKFDLTAQSGISECTKITVKLRARSADFWHNYATLDVKLRKSDDSQIGSTWRAVNGYGTQRTWYNLEHDWSSLSLSQSDIDGLRLELIHDSSFFALTQEVTAVDVEIEYTTSAGDETAPTVTLNLPAAGANLPSSSVTFNCTAYDNVKLEDVTLYGDWSGWHANETNSNPANNSPVIFTKTISDGLYKWNCYACDNSSNCAFASANRTFRIDTTAPVISSTSANISEAIVNDYARVTCTATDSGVGIDKFVIEADKPVSADEKYSTTYLSGDTWYADIQLTEAGIWSFKCYVNDTLGNIADMADGSVNVSDVSAEVDWNQSVLSIGTVQQGLSEDKNATVEATSDNTNVKVTELSGNGTGFISASPADIGNLNNGQTQQVIFTCSPSAEQAVGKYEAVYRVNSTEDGSGDDITISCDVTANAPPSITGISAAPEPCGFGKNITISATVTDSDGVDTVLIEITLPGGTTLANDTMTEISSNNYQYEFTDWENGTYDYRIYANDTLGNMESSALNQFSMYDDMKIQIKTMKDSYGAGEYVNITDPPGSTFGNENIGGSTYSLNNHIVGSWFTITEDGTAESISAYINPWFTGDHIKCAIYKKSDDSLVAETQEKTMNADVTQWYTFDFSTGPSLTASTDYYLTCWGDAMHDVYYDTETDKSVYDSESYGTWPDPLQPSGFHANRKYSIYCTYAVAGAPAYSNISTTGTPAFEGDIITASAYWIDSDSNLSQGVLRTNKTGTWENLTWTNFTSDEEWFNETINTSGAGGKTVCWNQWVKDVDDNWNKNMPEQCIVVYDTDLNNMQLYLRNDGGSQPPYDDTGFLNSTHATSIEGSDCAIIVYFYFDEDVSFDQTSLQNLYYHVWWKTNEPDSNESEIGWYHEYQLGGLNNPINVRSSTSKSNITHAGNTYYLESIYSDIDDIVFGDSNITDFSFRLRNSGNAPVLIILPNASSFIIFNLPDNSTLQGLDSDSDGLTDYQELYDYYTDPLDSDTDDGGESDKNEVDNGRDPLHGNDDSQGPSAPQYSNVSPQNNTVFDWPAIVTFSMTTDQDANLTVRYWDSGNSWTTTNTSFTSSPSAKSQSLSIGTYYWNFTVCNQQGNCTDSETYEFSVQTAEQDQSKIDNDQTNSLDTEIYLLMKVQWYNSSSGNWIDDDIVYDSTTPIEISAGNLLKLDQYFNGNWNTNDADYGDGTYRVWTAATDENNNVLENIDSTLLYAAYNFTISTS